MSEAGELLDQWFDFFLNYDPLNFEILEKHAPGLYYNTDKYINKDVEEYKPFKLPFDSDRYKIRDSTISENLYAIEKEINNIKDKLNE